MLKVTSAEVCGKGPCNKLKPKHTHKEYTISVSKYIFSSLGKQIFICYKNTFILKITFMNSTYQCNSNVQYCQPAVANNHTSNIFWATSPIKVCDVIPIISHCKRKHIQVLYFYLDLLEHALCPSETISKFTGSDNAFVKSIGLINQKAKNITKLKKLEDSFITESTTEVSDHYTISIQ